MYLNCPFEKIRITYLLLGGEPRISLARARTYDETASRTVEARLSDFAFSINQIWIARRDTSSRAADARRH